jgi:phenylacetate-CoA ligase
MIWNQAMETMPRPEIETLQSERLHQLARRVYERVPLYTQKFDELGLTPDDINRVADLSRLPFTEKSDLRDNYPFNLFAVPMEEVLRIHASSGTTGKPTVVGYTRDDLQTWAEVCARCLALSGAQPGEMFQNAYGYGLFTGGLGMHYGAEYLGMTVIPVSGGNTARQILLMQDFGPHVVACTPSYALTLADALEAEGVDRSSLNIKSFVLGAEPWTEAMRQEIEARLQIDAVNIYGLSEIIGPGVSNECVEAKAGSHIFEDHFIPEVINPDTGETLPEGEIGELVFTTLTKQAFPLIRYRTGDLASLSYEPCKCGRTHARMSRVVGRADDMLIIRGVNVFPSQIEEALTGIEYITPHHQIVVTRVDRLDKLSVLVEVTDEFVRHIGDDIFAGHPNVGVEEAHKLEDTIRHKLHSSLGINVEVSLAAPRETPRSEGGKLRRVIDKREL